jgi:hypothetical protein
MATNKRIIAATELVLIFPAALFMTAVVTRHLQPLEYEPAHTAQQIVTWYSVRHWTLWVLLIGMPFAAMLTGCATLLRNWSRCLIYIGTEGVFATPRFNTALGLFPSLRSNKVLPLIQSCRHSDIEKPNHHLVGGLITPSDRTRWIRIMRIIL